MPTPDRPQQEQELRALIHKHGLQSIEERIIANYSNTIALDLAPKTEGNKPTPREAGITSHLGGLPDVPEGWIWPKDLTFLGQINLEEVAPYDLGHLLPPRGLLLFFNDMYGWNGVDEGDRSGIPGKVEFIEDKPDGSRELHRTTPPSGYLPYSLSHNDGREIYREVRIFPRSVLSLPGLYTRGWEKICSPDKGENDLTEAYLNLLRDLPRTSHRHQLLGHHGFMDGDADKEAWSAEQGVSSRYIGQPIDEAERKQTIQSLDNSIQHYRETTDPNWQQAKEQMVRHYERQRDNYLRYLANKDEADAQLSEWILLFQMDSDDRIGTMFNDAGFAYFMIRRSDLAQARFDRVYCSLWSS